MARPPALIPLRCVALRPLRDPLSSPSSSSLASPSPHAAAHLLLPSSCASPRLYRLRARLRRRRRCCQTETPRCHVAAASARPRGQCATVDDRPHIALAPVAAGTPGAPAPLAKSHAAVSGACLHHPRHICRQTSTGLTCSCKTHPYPPRLITTTQPSTPPSKNRQLLPPTQLGPITLAGPNTTLSLPAAHCSRGAQLSEAALNHHAAVMVGIFIAIDAATPRSRFRARQELAN